MPEAGHPSLKGRRLRGPQQAKRKRLCNHCDQPIGHDKKINAIYCSDACRKNASKRRTRNRKKAENAVAANQARELMRTDRASIIESMEEKGLTYELRQGTITLSAVGRMLGVGRDQVKRAYDEWLTRAAIIEASVDWEMSDRVKYLLAHDLNPPSLLDHDECRKWAREAMERFMEFEREYFSLPGGEPYLREEFHKRWIEEILFAIATGGYLQVLSPPRHGKSELLIHFSVWLICRWHEIRIMWVGPNIDISTDMVGSVADTLEDNEQLINDVLPPDQFFAPPKRGAGAIWKRTEFRVDCQKSDRKGKTMIAVSRGKKVLSKDTDLIVCDDIEDFDSTVQPSNRANTRKWFGTGLDSRKEEHTALVVIGSRQHPDDLYGYNLEDPNFTTIVDSAHDPACVLDPDDWDIHTECMLFPAIRTYRWLMSKKHGAGARDESGIYEMVYLNDPQSEGYAIFDKDAIEASFNPSRGIGLEGIPPQGRRLIAGLDPAATGYQAAVLWAATPVGKLTRADWSMKRWLVDLENHHGGGIEHALELMKRWLELYGLRHWVIEDQGFQHGYRTDPRIKEFALDNNVLLRPHQTYGSTKYDPVYGTGTMGRLFPDLMDLPYGTAEAKQKSETLKRQAVRFTDDAKRQRKNVSDALMAGWFPQKQIRIWEKEAIAAAQEVESEESYEFGIAYPGLKGSGDMPWSTGYV